MNSTTAAAEFSEPLQMQASTKKIWGLAHRGGAPRQYAEVKAFGVDLHHVRRRRTGGNFVQRFDGHGRLRQSRLPRLFLAQRKRAAIVASRQGKGKSPGHVSRSRVDPLNLIAAIEQVLYIALQVVLRLDERVARVGKMLDGGGSPESAVGADVEDVFGSKPQPLQQCEKWIEALAGFGAVIDAHDPVTEYTKEPMDQALHDALGLLVR